MQRNAESETRINAATVLWANPNTEIAGNSLEKRHSLENSSGMCIKIYEVLVHVFIDNWSVVDKLSGFQNGNHKNKEVGVKMLHEDKSIVTLNKNLKPAFQKCRQWEKKIKKIVI